MKIYRNLTVLVITIFIFMANVAFAGGSGGGDHKYGKQEQEQNQTQSTNVNIGDISATGGNAESSANANATGGDQTVNIENPKSITGIPLINPPSSPETQLYHLTANAVEKGVNLTLLYNDLCRPNYAKELKNREEKRKNVQIIFTPHQDFLSAENKEKKVKDIKIGAPPENEKVKCLGILNAESVSKKKNIPLSALYSETGQYAVSELSGFDTIYLLSNNDAIAAARGVKNAGLGLSFAPGQSWLIGQATGAIGGGLSYGNGNAQGVAQIGTTFIVLGATPDGIIFELPKPQVQVVEKTIEKPPLTPQPIPEKKEKQKKKTNSRHYTVPNWE